MNGAEVILLESDDSNDGILKDIYKQNNHGTSKNDYSDSDSSDCGLPDINLDEIHAKKTTNSTKGKPRSYENYDQKNNENNVNVVNKITDKESQNDSDCDSQSVMNDYLTEYEKIQNANLNVSSSDEDCGSPEKEQQSQKQKGKRKAGKTKKVTEEEKQRKKEEREREKMRKQEEAAKQKEEREREKMRKQEEAAKQKALKQLNMKNRQYLNPENCIKLMEIVMDEEIPNFDFFTEFLRASEESELKYNVQSQLIPRSITWTRKVEENYLNDNHEICSTSFKVDENQMIVIWDCEETVKHIANDTFISTISNIKSLVPDKKLTLVLYKMESYFKSMKNMKDRAMRDNILNGSEREKPKKNKNKFDNSFANLPKITRNKFEETLVEIQFSFKANSRLIENAVEMVLLIHQYTKSLACLPAKLKKREASSTIDCFISCDNRDTVKVDKDGNGLKRLWQHQLCQFTLASLEVSEAITSLYKSPLQLMEAYANCSASEGEALLKDIPIRRGVGLLQNVRKIGPELSKKVFIMFTSEDGNVCLND